MRLRTHLAVTAAAAALAGPALAHEAVYEAPLLGSSESPTNASPATGFARVTFDFDLFTMRVEASFSDLVGTVTASHIHCCTTVAFSGNAAVATTTPTFTGFPLGGHLGTYDHTFDMTLASSYNAGPGSLLALNGGNISLTFNALMAGLDSGKAYLNVHTSTFPGGEIRGLLVAVPEPSTYAMMLVGLAGLGALLRRRSQA